MCLLSKASTLLYLVFASADVCFVPDIIEVGRNSHYHLCHTDADYRKLSLRKLLTRRTGMRITGTRNAQRELPPLQ